MCLLILLLAGLFGYYATPLLTDDSLGEDQELSDIPYAEYFQRYAPITGWDWHWLAAIGWEESHFNCKAHSSSGAVGVMQIMPKTAVRFGLNDSTIYEPEDNIRAGAMYIRRLQNIYSFIQDSVQNQLFVLASYNAGPAHIMDARRLAKRYGRSAYLWFDNTEYCLEQLADEQYAQDSVVQYGSFDAQQTISYVKKVRRTYDKFRL